MWVVDSNTYMWRLRMFSGSSLLRFTFVIHRRLQFFWWRGVAPTSLLLPNPCMFSDWKHYKALTCFMMSHKRMLTSSSSSVLFSSQMARTPKRSEAGLNLPVPHSLICNPVCGHGVKYRCIQKAGSTRQWCHRFCYTAARRIQYGWPTKGCWRYLAITASTALYTFDIEIAYQRLNFGTASASPA